MSTNIQLQLYSHIERQNIKRIAENEGWTELKFTDPNICIGYDATAINSYQKNILVEIKCRRVDSVRYQHGGVLMQEDKYLSLQNWVRKGVAELAYYVTLFNDGYYVKYDLRNISPALFQTSQQKFNQVTCKSRSNKVTKRVQMLPYSSALPQIELYTPNWAKVKDYYQLTEDQLIKLKKDLIF